jgi:hypothetical protein
MSAVLNRRARQAGPGARPRKAGLPRKTARPTDPIFAAIDKHRRAIDDYNRLSDVYAVVVPGTRGTKKAETAASAASGREIAALQVVLKTKPTTLEGVAALLEHLGQPQFGRIKEMNNLAGVYEISSGWKGDFERAAMRLPTMLAQIIRKIAQQPSTFAGAHTAAPPDRRKS